MTLPNQSPEYERGYQDGLTGRFCDPCGGREYTDGWHDGESDRPTMDDFVDPAMERVDPFGY